DSRAAASAIPASTCSIGSGTPMTPVEATSISAGAAPIACAACACMRRASRSPAAPVSALALPLFTTRPRALPFAFASAARDTPTGAAATRFLVNTAAAGHARSATISPTSNPPFCLIPALTPANEKPLTAITGRTYHTEAVFQQACGQDQSHLAAQRQPARPVAGGTTVALRTRRVAVRSDRKQTLAAGDPSTR